MMKQKLYIFILVTLVIAIITGSAYLFLFGKNREIDQKSVRFGAIDTTASATREISGKIRSVNEKTFYIELENGRGFAANININTLVMIEGIAKPGTLVDIKEGQNVMVKVSAADDAIQILIKK